MKDLCPLFAFRLEVLLREAARVDLRVDVHSGIRDFTKQDDLYALGRTVKNRDGATEAKPLGNIVTNARGGESWHNWGLAADVVFRDRAGKWTWSGEWAALGKIGEAAGLEWGGRWIKCVHCALVKEAHDGVDRGHKYLSKADAPHFQLTAGLSIPQAMEIWQVERVWDEVGKRILVQGGEKIR